MGKIAYFLAGLLIPILLVGAYIGYSYVKNPAGFSKAVKGEVDLKGFGMEAAKKISLGAIAKVEAVQNNTTAKETPKEPAKDSTPPTIIPTAPEKGSTVSSVLMIAADYTDPSGINTASAKMSVDGIDVTGSCLVTDAAIIYTPLSVAAGSHIVIVEVSDKIGNKADTFWSFTKG